MAMKSYQETVQAQIDYQIRQDLTWLNKFDREAVTPVTEPYLENASQPDLPLSEVKQLLERAVVMSQRYENSLETPEIWVRGAVILYFRGDFETAETYLDQAITYYQERKYPH